MEPVASGSRSSKGHRNEDPQLTPSTGSNRGSITAAFNQSNMIILVETDAGITGIGEGGSPDLVASLAPSVIGKNAFDTELIWQHMYMEPFYSPGREKIHALGGIDMALWGHQGQGAERALVYVDRREGADRPGLGISVEMAQLTPIAEHTTPATGNTYRRRDGSPSHW